MRVSAATADVNKSVNFLDPESPELHTLADHVVHNSETPGYELHESAGSKVGSCFVAANGERIPNRGEAKLRMKAGNIPIQSTFQVSKISKPLWSVGKLCDAGYKLESTKDAATIMNAASGKKIGNFKRSQGRYVGSLQLKNPTFLRQAK